VHSVTDKPIDDAFVSLLQKHGTMLTPTLVVFERYGRTFAHRLNLTAEEKSWGNPEVIATLDVTKLPPDKVPDRIKTALADSEAVLGRIQETYNVALKNLKTLEDAGIPIAAGTDAGGARVGSGRPGDPPSGVADGTVQHGPPVRPTGQPGPATIRPSRRLGLLLYAGGLRPALPGHGLTGGDRPARRLAAKHNPHRLRHLGPR